MKTLLLNTDAPDTPLAAAELLKKGELVAVPTETVYGLAAMATREDAVREIYEVKGRPETKPISLLIASLKEAEPLVTEIPEAARALAEAFWPGPLTMILKKTAQVPDLVTAGGATVGIRCPDHPVTRAIIALAGCALATPSANYSGEPSPVDAAGVLRYFDGAIAAVVDGGPCRVGVASTIVDLTRKPAVILRQGGIPEAEIRAVLSPLGY